MLGSLSALCLVTSATSVTAPLCCSPSPACCTSAAVAHAAARLFPCPATSCCACPSPTRSTATAPLSCGPLCSVTASNVPRQAVTCSCCVLLAPLLPGPPAAAPGCGTPTVCSPTPAAADVGDVDAAESGIARTSKGRKVSAGLGSSCCSCSVCSRLPGAAAAGPARRSSSLSREVTHRWPAQAGQHAAQHSVVWHTLCSHC
jgi:hypothetical protein